MKCWSYIMSLVKRSTVINQICIKKKKKKKKGKSEYFPNDFLLNILPYQRFELKCIRSLNEET